MTSPLLIVDISAGSSLRPTPNALSNASLRVQSFSNPISRACAGSRATAAISAGVSGRAATPSGSSRAFTSGSLPTSFIAAESRSTIGCGVPAGSSVPNQLAIS